MPTLVCLKPRWAGRVDIIADTGRAAGRHIQMAGHFTLDGITVPPKSWPAHRNAHSHVTSELSDVTNVHRLPERSATDLEEQLDRRRRGRAEPSQIHTLETALHQLELLRVYAHADPAARTVALTMVTGGFDGLPTVLDTAPLSAVAAAQPAVPDRSGDVTARWPQRAGRQAR